MTQPPPCALPQPLAARPTRPLPAALALLLLWCCALLQPAAAQSAQRVALLIGNQAYAQGALRFPRQDVATVRAALLDLGFRPADVVVLQDADQRALKRALSAFGARARGADVAFLYYSGHATQASGQNWLVPIGAEIRNEADYELEAVSAQAALAQLQEAAPALSIVVLDACRDNPVAVTKSGTKGLARMDAGTSTVLAFATAPNRTAADDGLYAQVLAAQLRVPGQEILDVFRNTGVEVRRRTNNAQTPRLSEVDLPRRYYLASAPTQPPVRPQQAEPQPEQQAWAAAQRAHTVQAYSAYLAEYPQGQYAGVARAALAALQPPPPPSPKPGDVIKDCEACPELVVVPGGSFTMGSPGDEPERSSDEGPQRRVTVQAFAAGRYEVTFGQWDACVAAGGCSHRPDDRGWGRGNRPVMNVGWEDAQQYVKWLSVKTGKAYRLLSEAEWEYAARAGTTTPFSTGRTITTAQANFDGNYTYNGSAKGEYRQKTVSVGQFGPNAFGLYDMHGNVWEWVQDVWHDSYEAAPTDGRAWVEGGHQARRVLRGGSWNDIPRVLRSAMRNLNAPGNRYDYTGFRIARTF